MTVQWDFLPPTFLTDGLFPSTILVSDGTPDVVDVVYVNIVTWSMGCVRVGEVAKGEQLIANQEQEWMGICTESKKAGTPRK